MTKLELLPIIELALQEKLKLAQANFNEAQESVLNETKGTAGDKHETGRAMAQIEVEKAGKLLRESENQLSMFNKLKTVRSSVATNGSLIHTNAESFFLGVPIGKIEVSGTFVFCISLQAPIGQILNAKKVGDHFSFNGKQYEIVGIE